MSAHRLERLRVAASTMPLAVVLTSMSASAAFAGTITGKLELPPGVELAARPVETMGFLPRIDNPLRPAALFDPTPFMVVVLVGNEGAQPPPSQVTWDLLGDSFSRPLLPVRVGTEVLIRNRGRKPVRLKVVEKPKAIEDKLLNASTINSANVTLDATAEGVHSVVEPDLPHLKGRVVAFTSSFFAIPDSQGRFEIKDVPAGAWTLRVWFRDGWIDRPEDNVTVGPAKLEVRPKIPAGFVAKTK
jgi:hypothetical protein